ncbi:orotate phosphoribosyltransferase [Ornithinibacillus contaminans]|uniref:orotate phosphoribosyltransferase n=1 Tax=Ornithinibacillus contaminans TaxID=694055 RepID=UPI00064E00A1|nr:orotate phosphoribosyltransferase [Ornithinibacillus contaminans]
MSLQKELAKDLLHIKAVQINPTEYFTWTSGIQSPIYCDNRITMSYPQVRKKIAAAFNAKISEMNIKPDVIAGCATAGIPHAAWLADLLNLPMVYVRSKPKGHGKGNQIEGASVTGKKVLVIEDLISTGGSALEAVDALRSDGAEVLSVFSIVTYGLKKASDNFAQSQLTYESLTSYEMLLEALIDENKISEEDKVHLLKWRTLIES